MKAAFQTNIDEGRLHSGHYSNNLAIEDIPYVPAVIMALDEYLLQQAISISATRVSNAVTLIRISSLIGLF